MVKTSGTNLKPEDQSNKASSSSKNGKKASGGADEEPYLKVSSWVHFFESLFQKSLKGSGWIMILLLVGIFITLFYHSLPSIQSMGLEFFYSSTWNPVSDKYGALPFLVGTLLTSFLALLISLPFSMSIAIYLGEYVRKGIFSNILKNLVELLAAIPSVIYGFWGLLVLVPIIRKFEIEIGVTPYGVSIFAAALVLAIMIIPYSASIAREVINMTPSTLKEAAYSLGATRFEVIKTAIIPYSKSGIMAGILLALGRALGETMAVTMVIGNANKIPESIFSPGNTMASAIANEFTEATGDLYLSALIEIGLLLFVVTAVINIIGKKVIQSMRF